MTTPLNTQDEEAPDKHLRQLSVAGAVLRAARLSAGLTVAQLGSAVGVSGDTIRSWEDGTESLADVPMTQIEAIKDTLRGAAADKDLIADLEIAAWSDVVVRAMAGHEDLRCLLADPMAREPSFGELLSWALSGHEPIRFAGRGAVPDEIH